MIALLFLMKILSPTSDLKMANLPGASPFYPALDFQTRKDLKKLPFPNDMMITDNFFRPSWIGIGDRRLKNIDNRYDSRYSL